MGINGIIGMDGMGMGRIKCVDWMIDRLRRVETYHILRNYVVLERKEGEF